MGAYSALEQASRTAQSGNKPQAQAILTNLIRQEPQNEAAWLLLSEVVWKKEHAVDCLEHVLRLNPSNEQARRRLEELKQAPSPQAQRASYPPTPPPVQSPSPQVSLQEQAHPLIPPQTKPIQNSTGHTKQWAILGTLALLICTVFSVGSVLIWRSFKPAFSQSPIVTVIAPATLDSQASPLPPSPAVLYPTLPPAWTPTTKPEAQSPPVQPTRVIQCTATVIINTEKSVTGRVTVYLDGKPGVNYAETHETTFENVCMGPHTINVVEFSGQALRWPIDVKRGDTVIAFDYWSEWKRYNVPLPPGGVCYNCP